MFEGSGFRVSEHRGNLRYVVFRVPGASAEQMVVADVAAGSRTRVFGPAALRRGSWIP